MYTSELETAKERFLSLCLQQAVNDGWLSSAALLEEFPPKVLVAALEPALELRTALLVGAAGVHEKIAAKKSIAAAAEDLEIALQEGVCTSDDVLSLLPFDEQLRYLSPQALWDFLVRDEFFKTDDSRAQARMLFVLQQALEQQLLTQEQIVQALSPEKIARCLPKALIEEALSRSLTLGMQGSAFSPESFFDTLALETCLKHLSLAEVWDEVVLDLIVPACELGGATDISPAASQNNAEEIGVEEVDSSVASATSATSAPPESSPVESQARSRAIGQLSTRDRLPNQHSMLSTPTLLAIETMYADLDQLSDEEERAEAIREAFPNEHMLQDALFALAVTLDPQVSEEQLRSRTVDSAGLIQLVLFEEKKRMRLAQGPQTAEPSSVPPPPLSSVGAKHPPVAPPAPSQGRRASIPPPPLPAQKRGARS